MKHSIKIALIAASLFVSGAAFARDDQNMKDHDSHHAGQSKQNTAGNQMPMDKMLDMRMQMMKSELKLNKNQEKAFNAFVKQKKALMQDMMDKMMSGKKGAMGMNGMQGNMGNQQGMNGMHGGKGNQQGMTGMQGNMGNQKGMNGMQGNMGNRQGMNSMQGGMGGGMGMMRMMSGMRFSEHLDFMQSHAQKMLSTAKAGKNFYNTLSKAQKKKLNDMHKNMQGMNMGMGNGKGGMQGMK